MLMLVSALPSWPGIDDLLSMLGLFHLDNLELLSSVILPDGRAQPVTLVFNDGLVEASDEALYL